MANEIRINLTATVKNGNFRDQFAPGQISINQASQGAVGGIVNVGTGGENLSLPDITTLGVVVGRNLDAANYVEFGFSTSTGSTGKLGLKILAGEAFCFRLKPGINWRAKANTAAVDVERHVYEN